MSEMREDKLLSQEKISSCSKIISAIIDNIETVLIGKRNVVELVMTALLSKGHVLIEDVPGVGKTSLVKALAQSVSCGFKRIQFTPDIMPSDITGFSIYNQKNGEFEFCPGAVMSNIILADEINRASAKTQSSLLEAMEEKQVTVDSVTYSLQEPFMVLATQNPVESFGTYPLPEAQMDRFLMKLSIGYPSIAEEISVSALTEEQKRDLPAVISAEDIIALRAAADIVYISPALSKYIVEIIAATRNNANILLGSSPRGSIALHRLCRSYALLKGRGYTLPEDVKYLAPYALAHRIILSQEAKLNKKDALDIINEIVQSIMVPVE